MKTFRLLAATLSVAAMGAIASLPAQAQETTNPTTSPSGTGTTTQTPGTATGTTNTTSSSSMPMGDQEKKPRVETNASGKPTVVVPEGASAADQFKTGWIFRNLDAREVRRFQTQGFSDDTIKGAANIALRTGLSLEYVLRMFRESGYPLQAIAAMYSVPTNVVNADIPGYGADTVAVAVPPTRTTSTMPMTGTYSSSSTSSMTTGTATTGTSSSSSLGARGILDVAQADPQFANFATLVRASGLADTLRGAGPYTILAPTNAAFAKLPAGTLDFLLRPENQSTLRTILTYHVLPGRVMASDVQGMTNPSSPRTLEGSTLNVKTTAPVMINNANVTQTDIAAANGVIHAIDTVLLPTSVSLPGASSSSPSSTPATGNGTTPATPAPTTPAADPGTTPNNTPATNPATPTTPGTNP